MKKKILAVALSLTLCLGLTGCDKGDIEPEASDLGNKYIDLVTIYRDEINCTEVMYDKIEGVMYLVKWDNYRFGITPIYKADGTPKLYDGK